MLSPTLLIMLIAVVVLALASVRRIPEGQVYSLRRLGGQTRYIGAGLHFVLPLIERVSHRVSLTGSRVEACHCLRSGEDCTASVYYQVLDPQRAEAVIDTVDSLIADRAGELMASPDLPADTGDCRLWLKQSLNAEIRDLGLLVTRIDLSRAA